ncbi:MAG: CHC2 zinc finger domain-containing protein, partial [Verrucomicrobiota bacterium]
MAGIIAKQTIEEIKARNDIVDVVGVHVPLKRAGNATYKGLCPFHKEKTPSFNVNPQRQSFHCFGCHAGGDVFSFSRRYEGVDFTTAARMLAGRVGIDIEFSEADRKSRSDKDVLFKLLESATEFYHRLLRDDGSAAKTRDYLKTRGLETDTVDQFRIGYAPGRSNPITRWARSEGFTEDHLE